MTRASIALSWERLTPDVQISVQGREFPGNGEFPTWTLCLFPQSGIAQPSTPSNADCRGQPESWLCDVDFLFTSASVGSLSADPAHLVAPLCCVQAHCRKQHFWTNLEQGEWVSMSQPPLQTPSAFSLSSPTLQLTSVQT